MKTKLFFAALALMAAVSFTMAQDNKDTQSKGDPAKACFVDANNDGLCDKAATGCCNLGQGQGLKNGQGNGQALRDGSGSGQALRNGTGNGQGLRNGNGNRQGLRNGTGNGKAK